ncbi:MAG: sel1 repeat family protein, partial [Rhodospirillaceae bacterium]|nr:sel1 repeat family protein [Rhodospirillaceae bacterium]
MKKTALAAVLATTVILAPWNAALASDARDFLYGQRLYSLGDYAGAFTTWQPLAEQGDARAQFSVAVLYLKGRGIPLDKAKAQEWARRAAEQGYKPGKRLLQSLQPKKTKIKAAALPKPGKATAARKTKSQMTELERIEAAVEALLQQIAFKVAKGGALDHGDLRAEQLASAIEVTIPDIVIQAADGGVFDIGTVVAHVRRQDSRYDDITVALPGSMRFQKADGAKGAITIAKRLAKLRWDRELATSTEFEFRLNELLFSLEGKGEMGRVGEVLVRAEVLEDEGLWTGPMRFAVTDVKISNGETSTLQLGQFNLVMDMRGLDLPAFNQNLDRSQAKGQAKLGGNPSLQQILGLANGFGL